MKRKRSSSTSSLSPERNKREKIQDIKQNMALQDACLPDGSTVVTDKNLTQKLQHNRPRRRKKKVIQFSNKPEYDKLGYNNNMTLSFAKILCNKIFHEKVRPDLAAILKPENLNLLLDQILHVQVEGTVVPKSRIVCGNKLVDILKEMTSRWRKFKIKHFLDKKCPSRRLLSQPVTNGYLFADKCILTRDFLQNILIPAGLDGEDKEKELELIKTEFGKTVTSFKDGPLNLAQSWRHVRSFMLAIVKLIIPLELFGSKHNSKCFQKVVKAFLMLGKNETLTLKTILFEVKISHCKWTKHLNCFTAKSKIVAKMWVWLLKRFIAQVLKSFFYITESGLHGNHLFFFRKRDFQGLHQQSIEELLKNGQFIKKKNEAVRSFDVRFRAEQKLRLPKLRFIPKATGMRLIHSLKNASLTHLETQKAKLLLDHMTKTFFQSSTRSLPHFISLWSEYRSSVDREDLPLYAVKVDIRDAFGSINLNILLSLLKRTSRLLPKVIHFKRVPKKASKPNCFKYVVCSPSEKCELRLDVEETTRSVVRVIVNQAAKLNSSTLLMKVRGVAQGASLSSYLCDLYYGAMFQEYLAKFCCDRNRLVRCVDDFLFVTPDLDEARAFSSLMEGGIQFYGCYINTEKTVHNLDGVQRRIPFMQILLCTASKQLLVPVTNLVSYPPRYSLRVDKPVHPGNMIGKKFELVSVIKFIIGIVSIGLFIL